MLTLIRRASTEAQGRLRTALTMQLEISTAREAARTRVVLAQALVAAAGGSGRLPDEAR